MKVPLYDIPMMTDERWHKLALAQARNNFVRAFGREPVNDAEAGNWQREQIERLGLTNGAPLAATSETSESVAAQNNTLSVYHRFGHGPMAEKQKANHSTADQSKE